MANGMLSQEEIEALLSGPSGAEENEVENTSSSATEIELTEIEIDALGEIANISMGTAATTLSQLVGRKVEITTPVVDLTTIERVFADYPVPHVLIDVRYKSGVQGSNMLVLSRQDGAIIVDLMLGGPGEGTNHLSEMQISGIAEAMNQMMGSAATSMSTLFDKVVDITPPQVVITDDENQEKESLEILNTTDPLVRISFKMIVEGIIDSILVQVLPLEVAKEMAAQLLSPIQGAAQQTPKGGQPKVVDQAPLQEQPETQVPPETHNQQMSAASLASGRGTSWKPPQEPYYPPQSEPRPTYQNNNNSTPVEPVQFTPLIPDKTTALPNNLELIYDVPLQVNVELGRANKTIREILDLGPGSVVELDRLAGEPVDMYVNGKLIAKCEVVVINETFGIRITEIISPDDRIETLN
ncbi:MAG: flagellar motor switch phosphatase FliY [Desulfitobacteriia bacterium]|jgi:flagellar motor switch protein FliN/FliY